MSSKYSVHITYRNEQMMPVADELFPLDEYTTILKNDLLRMISDVEDLIYAAYDGRSKAEWKPEVWLKFQKIKHKLCDKAGEIDRLSANLVEGGVTDGTDHQAT